MGIYIFLGYTLLLLWYNIKRIMNNIFTTFHVKACSFNSFLQWNESHKKIIVWTEKEIENIYKYTVS